VARPVPVTVEDHSEERAPSEYAPAYFIMIPGVTYKAISDAAAKRNMTLAQLVSNAFTEYLKKTGD
jgi:hypothetical protein